MLGAMGWLNTEPEFENSKFQLLDPSKNIILGQGISLPNKYICEGKTAASRIAHNVINENGFGDAKVFFLCSKKDFQTIKPGTSITFLSPHTVQNKDPYICMPEEATWWCLKVTKDTAVN